MLTFFATCRMALSPKPTAAALRYRRMTMTKIDDATILSISGNASFQSLGEGAVVLLIDSGQLYICNETTEAFLKLVDGNRRLGAIVDALLNEFDIERSTAAGDFREIAEQLQSEGILEIKKAP